MQKDFWKELFRPENKKVRRQMLLMLLAGMVLLTSGSWFAEEKQIPTESVQTAQTETRQADRTEKRMAEVLSKIEGAGQVEVMLTYRKTEEKKVAQQEVREESKGEQSESLRTETEIVLLEDGKGNTLPLVLSADSPVVEGAVIVAQGGADPAVCAALNHAAQALLDVPAHKIAVLKMK